jgi:hypothetical protein
MILNKVESSLKELILKLQTSRLKLHDLLKKIEIIEMDIVPSVTQIANLVSDLTLKELPAKTHVVGEKDTLIFSDNDSK